MIIFATEKNGIVYAYDDNEKKVLSEPGKLDSYTNNTVAIVRNNKTYIYDDNGKITHTYPDFVDIRNIV